MEWFLNSLFLAWAGALLGAFPLALWVAIALRNRTGVCPKWRSLVCGVLACALTPSFLNVKGGAILPAVLVGWIEAMERDGFSVLILGLLPICLVTLGLFSIWSIQLKLEARGSETKIRSMLSADEQGAE
jgi:hypothetical protein